MSCLLPNSSTSKYDTSLKVDISKYISEENKKNKPDNYDSVEISYIQTNDSYEISNNAKWSDVKTIKFSEFDKDEYKSGTTLNGINYSKTENLISKSYSNTANDPVTEYYVIKVVTKYNVKGAEDIEPVYKTVSFTYNK